MRRRNRGLLIGTLIGAILGTALAWAILDSDDGTASQFKAKPSDWFKLGIALLGVAKQMGDLVRRG